MKKVSVIGAGISGLSVAFYIRKLVPGTTVVIFEKEDFPGGKMRTCFEHGFIIEEGPNGFLDNRPHTLDLVNSLRISDKLYGSSDDSRRRYIYFGGRLHRLPETPLRFLSSRLLTFKGKARILEEFFIKKGIPEHDESLYDFAVRRLGVEAAERLIDPMVSGIFAGDPRKLSLRAAFPRVYELERDYGGLFKGLIAVMKERGREGKGWRKRGTPAGPGGNLTSFTNGVHDLIARLQVENENLYTGVSQIELYPLEKGGYRIEFSHGGGDGSDDFDSVVVATPSYAASKILKSLNPRLSILLEGIPYSPIAVTALGFHRSAFLTAPDGFGVLIPAVEKRPILGCLFDSNIFPNRAPEGKVLLRVMSGGARSPEIVEMPEEKVINCALSEIERILKPVEPPVFVRLFRHIQGIPHYLTSHPQRMEAVEEELKCLRGVFLCNNAYYGIGLNDCVGNALKTAEKVRSFLTE